MFNRISPLFPIERVQYTPKAMSLMSKYDIQGWQLIERHNYGDFGDCGEILWASNLRALEHGGKIISVYEYGSESIWVITKVNDPTTYIRTPYCGEIVDIE